MLYTIAVILIVLWLVGVVSAYTLGGFIHILLVIAVISILLRVIQNRRICRAGAAGRRTRRSALRQARGQRRFGFHPFAGGPSNQALRIATT
jgi:hypothetical protein